MKLLIVVLSLIIFISPGYTQNNRKPQKAITTATATSFPASFIGNWKGTLLWYRAGAKEPKKNTMRLSIQPSKDSAGQYTWHLSYGDSAKDERSYLLKPVDTAKGHWVIDELNGILLDLYFSGGKLWSVFTVETVTIFNNYWLENGNLVTEFTSWPIKALQTTGKGTEDAPFVNSYDIKTYQKAVLKSSDKF